MTARDSVLECAHCRRGFGLIDVYPCSICGLELCADCLGANALGSCLVCSDAAAPAPAEARRSVLVIMTAFVPRSWQMRHVLIRRVVGAHAEVEDTDGGGLGILPVCVLAGATRQVAAFRAGSAVLR